MSKNLQKIAKDNEDIDLKFATEFQMLCDWIDTTNLIVIGGRGVAKSTVIIASRTFRCILDMPGAPIAIIANTYSNLVNNIMPAVQNGWRLRGWIEGVHYIKGKRPPESWRKKCTDIVDNYQHVYSFWNGTVLYLGSMDDPSLLAGKSVTHLFWDETKFVSEQRSSRAMPILRGNAIAFGRSVYFMGVTITTDMPDITEGENDWFFRYASEMDPNRIVKIVQAASLLNDILLKLEKENHQPKADAKKIERLERKRDYYLSGLHKMRKGQTFFGNFSSFANIDILTLDYARRMYEGALEFHEFLKSVMGMRPGVRKSARFYVLFGEDHKYSNGTTSNEAAFSSSDLVYLDPTKPIDGGMDFGNMLSLVIAQADGQYYRVHKDFYTLPPDWFRQLADQFLDFFAGHKNKTLYLYYDRAANNKQRQKDDDASKIKEAIEKDAEGRRTGWNVVLMSRKQATIYQDQEYNFMLELMTGKNKALPLLKVDTLNCPEMISSIELAKCKVYYKGDRKIICKDKRSEKLDLKKLPRLSTNFSDAFKYLMMRKQWLSAVRSSITANTGADALVEQWMQDHSKK